ncbi:MAG TPA: magnesium transporter CorA family protein [Chlamydiales bacterium]|nr:magnesium transporter CorA family protein [Chlamydiales bacterium]
MLEIYFKTLRDTEFSRITDFQAGSWIYAKEANLEDLTKIAEIAHLDLNDIRDSLDKYELPRIEHIEDNIFFFIRHPGTNEFGLYTETLTLILTNTFVIAISPHRSEIIENLISSNTSLGTSQKSKLILHILLKITQDYTNNIKRVRHSILGAEQPPKIVDSNAIIVLTKNEEILNQYLTSIVPMRNVLEAMASGRYMNFYEQDLDLLEDLMIAMHQSEDVCRVNIKSIRSLRDSYHIIFTNDVNRTIKLLTALTIILSIPMIVVSIYGMNIALPFQTNTYAFPLIMGITIGASLTVLALFKRNRWL